MKNENQNAIQISKINSDKSDVTSYVLYSLLSIEKYNLPTYFPSI